MTTCRRCGGPVERSFRFCPWCAAPQRLKLTAFFPASGRNRSDAGKALRVSRYLGEHPHVRLSVWTPAGQVEGAVSIDGAEARQLADFLLRGSGDLPTRRGRLAEARGVLRAQFVRARLAQARRG
jgi:hypothetical protein